MAVPPAEPVYLGAPSVGYTVTPEDDGDAYMSKIGGSPAWLRPVIATPDAGAKGSAALGNCARCPKCRSAANLRLLAQLHAPLEVFDRVHYVFMCAACSSPTESVVCSFRSQLYNPSYDTERTAASSSSAAAATADSAAKDESLFAVDDDDGWGDDDDGDAAPSPTPAAATAAASSAEASARVAPPPPVYPSASAADNAQYAAAVSRAPLPPLALDTFPEPEGEKEKKGAAKSVAEQLAEVEALHPGITEVSGEAVEVDSLPHGGGGKGKGGGGNVVFVDDDGPTETPDEQASAEFFARLARCPKQCVRWSPNGAPLLSSASRRPPPASAIPGCSNCGAARVFEFQVLSPAIYFFEKEKERTAKKGGDGGKKLSAKAAKLQTIAAVEGAASEPHFATISVFTCSAHCYDAAHTVNLEYAHVEPEL